MDKRLTNQFLAIGLLLIGLSSHSKIGVDLQMQLGDPSDAKTDPRNHEHYLIQRSVFAEDYDDKNGEPNWVELGFDR